MPQSSISTHPFSVVSSFLRIYQVPGYHRQNGKQCWFPSCFYKISLKDTSFHISINSLGLCFSIQNVFPPCVKKSFKLMLFKFQENALNLGIFTHVPPYPLKTCPQVIIINPQTEGNYSFSQAASFQKSVSSNSRKGWEKIWFDLSKFNQKIWRWLGTLGYLYFVQFLIFFQM